VPVRLYAFLRFGQSSPSIPFVLSNRLAREPEITKSMCHKRILKKAFFPGSLKPQPRSPRGLAALANPVPSAPLALTGARTGASIVAPRVLINADGRVRLVDATVPLLTPLRVLADALAATEFAGRCQTLHLLAYPEKEAKHVRAVIYAPVSVVSSYEPWHPSLSLSLSLSAQGVSGTYYGV